MSLQTNEKIEESFKKVKMDNSAFKNLCNDKRCDPGKLKEFFSDILTKLEFRDTNGGRKCSIH